MYQVNGEGIGAVPLAADFLLSSSFRFSEDLTMVGGKEVATYGIDLNTGKVREMRRRILRCLLQL